MQKKYFIILILFSICSSSIYSARIDTVTTLSNVMQKKIKAVVVTPDSYSATKPLPVIYLLHGYGDNYSGGWIKKGKGFEKLADIHNVIIVCPDGGVSSWYFDSPIDKSYQYETYMIKELIPWIDKHYCTVKKKEGRAITGLSMGGHGALYLAFRHQDLFGAAGSMSGGVDIRPFPNNWDIAKRLGKYSDHPENWEKNTVINMLHLLKPGSLSLIIDCGTDDFFYKVNCQLHDRMINRKIDHDFISRPGAHTWDYWKNAIQYQVLFMSNYFRNVKEKK